MPVVAKRANLEKKTLKMNKLLSRMNLDNSAIQNAQKKKIDVNSSSDSDSE